VTYLHNVAFILMILDVYWSFIGNLMEGDHQEDLDLDER
jgi:hypothetical protein